MLAGCFRKLSFCGYGGRLGNQFIYGYPGYYPGVYYGAPFYPYPYPQGPVVVVNPGGPIIIRNPGGPVNPDGPANPGGPIIIRNPGGPVNPDGPIIV